ncbi:TPA: autotransporter outer membrane beta-barrel domain-containing protein, partial [Neisseria gonorrhoeae]
KLRDRNSEYWKEETYHIKSNGRTYPNIPALFPKHPFDPFENINNSKKISFYDKEYTEDYLVGFARGFGVEKRNGEEEKPLRQYFKDCVNTENSNNDNCKISSFGNYGPILIKSDIFALASQIKNSHINSEILSVGNYIEWLRPTLNKLTGWQEHLYAGLDPFHYIEVTDNSHVIGQTIDLGALELTNSLW